MRYLKFLKIPINYSAETITIKNNDEKGYHWLFLTLPNFFKAQTPFVFLEFILQDPFGNDFGIFLLNFTHSVSTANYIYAPIIKDSKGMPVFIPYNWSLLIYTDSGNSGSITLGCLVLAFDSLEELIDYAFGNAK